MQYHRSSWVLALSSSLSMLLCACAPKAPVSQDLAPPAAVGESAPEDHLCRQIFEMCDMNRDAKITKDEYAHGAIVTFHQLDQDHDLKLTKQELSGRWDADAQAADSDGDGVLCLSEIVKHQEESFAQRDVNQCGSLTETDVKTWVKTKLSQEKGAPERPGK